VRGKMEDEIDFSMDTGPLRDMKNTWAAALVSRTLSLFYLSLIGIMLVVMYFVK
jgi:hypothetical protein